MRDAYGRELGIGQLVAFAVPNGRSGGSARIGRVIGFTAKKVRLRGRMYWHGSHRSEVVLRDPGRVTFLDDPAPPEHDWQRPPGEDRCCTVCGERYGAWNGDPCWELDLKSG